MVKPAERGVKDDMDRNNEKRGTFVAIAVVEFSRRVVLHHTLVVHYWTVQRWCRICVCDEFVVFSSSDERGALPKSRSLSDINVFVFAVVILGCQDSRTVVVCC